MADNIDRFNKYAALAFAKLYESFPSPVDLDARELVTGKPQTENEAKEQARDLGASDEVRFACDCLRWLMDNGYIKAPDRLDRNMTRIRKAVATPATLQALSATQNGDQTLGEKIRGAIRDAGVDGLKDAGKNFMSSGIGWMVGAVISTMVRP